ncbi:MAG: glycosyltransferase family 4 protein [Candidatus Pacearchaeota archaeon]|nr:glycosyltransferase family 4 protein [Candidatus Pacearchaeota archaeon]
MKVNIVALFFWPVKPLVYPYNMAKALKEHGHEIEVSTMNEDADREIIKRPIIDSFEGIKIRRSKVYFAFTEFLRLWFPKISKDNDIIHCCGGYRHFHTFWAYLKKGNAKFVISPFFPMHPRKNPIKKFYISLIDKTIGRYLISHSDLCLAETKVEAVWLRSLGAKKVEIIPNMLDNDLYKLPKHSNFKKKYKIKGKMVLNISNHTPIKNFEDMIRAAQYIDATFVFGGKETAYTEKIKKLAKELNVDKKIIWTGFMDKKEKINALADCDLFVLPSTRESLGMSLIEAMAQEKPVISTNRGGIPEVVPDKFCLYEPGDYKTFSSKINEILNNKTLAFKIAKKGRENAKNYLFKNVAEKYTKIMERLYDKR